MMDHAVDEFRKPRIRTILQTGAKKGLTVCRTWAFNYGDYNAFQISPGRFDERVFRALDHVIAETNQYRIRLILFLVNNLQAYGGKTQYVKWAWEEGIGLRKHQVKLKCKMLARGKKRLEREKMMLRRRKRKLGGGKMRLENE
ncbi:hypothetical protein BUALT_Bualt10G0009100 [Buddleja alternifolia]|uniref:mannan endo-1,4-beta-mannosidase n=1 Tax=Buddleja alternifolia TaxID=168488 RepID=A0AAV6X344_9LAMI|nr:hypothetical protein BUALT_Bualt10G0009100 [Buddleja alternifolia]